MMKKMIYLMLLSIAASFPACSESDAFDHSDGPRRKNPFSNYSNEIIIQWNTTAREIMQGPEHHSLLVSRIMAMVHIAMHDALNNIAPVYETYALNREDKKADPIAAVSAAAHAVLTGSFPNKKQPLDSALNEALKLVKSGTSRERGIALGVEAGAAILAMRKNDGAFADPVAQVNNPPQPGLFQAVPPLPFLYAPFWANMQTFGIESAAQFRVPAMPSLSSDKYTEAYNEVKSKGIKENSTRTAEETSIAKFWYEFSEIGWNRVTATAVRDKNLDLVTTTRLFALVNMGLADSYTAGWDSKMHHNFWRPYTAIRVAATDGNDQTAEDATWEPLMNTPPIHDYPSTHSVLGNAAATILTAVLGKDTGFTMTSSTAEPVNSTRTFDSFTQAAIENADSRVFAGIHFRFSCESGLKLGEDIGEWIINHKLKPKDKSL
jgi:hypothetical protein